MIDIAYKDEWGESKILEWPQIVDGVEFHFNDCAGHADAEAVHQLLLNPSHENYKRYIKDVVESATTVFLRNELKASNVDADAYISEVAAAIQKAGK